MKDFTAWLVAALIVGVSVRLIEDRQPEAAIWLVTLILLGALVFTPDTLDRLAELLQALRSHTDAKPK